MQHTDNTDGISGTLYVAYLQDWRRKIMAKEFHYNEKIHFVDTICSSFLPEDQGTIIDTLTKKQGSGGCQRLL